MPVFTTSRRRRASHRLRPLRFWTAEPPRRVLGSRHVWLAVAAWSVALLLVAARRRQRADASATTRAPPARAPQPPQAGVRGAPPRDARPVEQQSFSRPRPERGLPNAPVAPKHSVPAAPRARFLSRGAPCSIEIPLPAVHRAALAISLGKPNDLRRLARDLQRAGQDIEAGLLDNYALLLERTRSDRDRLLAEVTRMLRAAAAERRSARRATPAIPWPPSEARGGLVAARDVAQPAAGAARPLDRPPAVHTAPGKHGSPSTQDAGATASHSSLSTSSLAGGQPGSMHGGGSGGAGAPQASAGAVKAHDSGSVVLLPLLAVGIRRRAGR